MARLYDSNGLWEKYGKKDGDALVPYWGKLIPRRERYWKIAKDKIEIISTEDNKIFNSLKFLGEDRIKTMEKVCKLIANLTNCVKPTSADLRDINKARELAETIIY